MKFKTLPLLLILIVGQLQLLAQEYFSPGRDISYQSQTFLSQTVKGNPAARLAAVVTDQLEIGNTDSETAHNLNGTNRNSGTSNGRNWVNANNGWLTMDMAVDPVGQHELVVTYWGSDAVNRSFTILVDGVRIAHQVLNNNKPGEFFEVKYGIPLSLTRHKEKVTVKFQSDQNKIAGDLYGIKIQKQPEPGEQWPVLTHDPSSIIKCKDTYWIFGTGDGVQALYSKNLVTWKTGPSPFAKWDIPSWIFQYAPRFEGHYWAPECFYMNDQYYLYYSVSEWGTKNSAIGVAVNKTLDPEDPEYKWEDLGVVVGSNWSSNYNAIDPAVVRDPNTKKVWFVYGSFNYAGIKVAELDTVSGKIKDISKEKSIANHWVGGNNYAGEAALMIYRDGYFYLFWNFGGCCEGINSTYYMVMGRSTSPQGPFLDKEGRNMFQNASPAGGTVLFRHDDSKGREDRYYGPGHPGYFEENGVEYLTFHYYDPNFPYPAPHNVGGPMLGMGMLKWGEDKWPTLSLDWVEKGRYTVSSFQNNLRWTNNQSGEFPRLFQSPVKDQDAQLWDFIPLGRGEYKLASAVDTTLVIESYATSQGERLRLAKFTNSINQKFRMAEYKNGEVMVYQSAGLQNIEIPWAVNQETQLGLWWFNGLPNQKWVLNRVGDIPVYVPPVSPPVTSILPEELQHIEVYPNPTENWLRLRNLPPFAKIELLDLSGKLLLQSFSMMDEHTLDLPSLNSGLYQLRISYKNSSVVKKVLKQ